MRSTILKTLLVLTLVVCVFSCKKEDVIDKNYFKELAPKGWQVEEVKFEEKYNYFEQLNDTTQFILKFTYLDSTYQIGTKTFHPELILNFYPYSKIDAIEIYIANAEPFERCLPIKYSDKNPYVLVTSSCFVNGGNNSANERARKLTAPLHKRFKSKTSNFNFIYQTE